MYVPFTPDATEDTSSPDVAEDTAPDTAPDTASDTTADAADLGEVGSDDPCDFSGLWAAKASPYALESVFNSQQRSNNWYLLEVEDHGEEFEIVGGYQCGIRVEGAASVTLTAASTEALRVRNSPVGRRGTFVLDGDTCRVRAERTWLVRGGAPELLPDDFSDERFLGDDAVDQIEAVKPLPTDPNDPLVIDIEEDGNPGMSYQVGGAAPGTRYVLQRDWNEWGTSDDYPLAPEDMAESFTLDFWYDTDEEIFGVGDCEFGCGLLEAGSSRDPGGDHHIDFVRVTDEIRGSDDLETCFNVQDTIPFERP